MGIGGILASLAGGAGRNVEYQAKENIKEQRKQDAEDRAQEIWESRYATQRKDQVADIESNQAHQVEMQDDAQGFQSSEGSKTRTHQVEVLGSEQGWKGHQNQLDRDLKIKTLNGELSNDERKLLAEKVQDFDSFIQESFETIDDIRADPDLIGDGLDVDPATVPRLIAPIYARLDEYARNNPHLAKYSRLYPTISGEIDQFFDAYAPKEPVSEQGSTTETDRFVESVHVGGGGGGGGQPVQVSNDSYTPSPGVSQSENDYRSRSGPVNGVLESLKVTPPSGRVGVVEGYTTVRP